MDFSIENNRGFKNNFFNQKVVLINFCKKNVKNTWKIIKIMVVRCSEQPQAPFFRQKITF